MAGFAVVIDPRGIAPDDADAAAFVDAVAAMRDLPPGAGLRVASTPGALAVKLNAPTTLHPRPATHAATGSWLMAAGTLLDQGAGQLDALLVELLGRPDAAPLATRDGVFGVVAGDGRDGSVLVATDHFGFFPVHLASRGRRTYIASSALGIARHLRLPLDRQAAWTFLLSGRGFAPDSLFEGVRRLGPAEAIRFRPGSAGAPASGTYWRLAPDLALAGRTLADAVESSVAAVTDALRRRHGNGSPTWVDLTGGWDSRFLAMLLERAGVDFVADTVGGDAHPDVRIARSIVRRTGWPHEHLRLPRDWPERGPAAVRRAARAGDGLVNVFGLSRALWAHEQEAKRSPLLLNGLGGELWRGISWWPEGASAGRSPAVHYERQLWSLLHPLPPDLLPADAERAVRADLLGRFRAAGEVDRDEPNTRKLDRLWGYREIGHAGAWSTAPAGVIRALPALFSPEIVRVVASLDPRWRRGNAVVRHAFARFRPELTRDPIESRGPAGPLGPRTVPGVVAARLGRGRLAAAKAGQILFRRPLVRREADEGYSRSERRRAVLASLAGGRQLGPHDLRTAGLYRADGLERLLAAAAGEPFIADELVGRVVTLELALREVAPTVD